MRHAGIPVKAPERTMPAPVTKAALLRLQRRGGGRSSRSRPINSTGAAPNQLSHKPKYLCAFDIVVKLAPEFH